MFYAGCSINVTVDIDATDGLYKGVDFNATCDARIDTDALSNLQGQYFWSLKLKASSSNFLAHALFFPEQDFNMCKVMFQNDSKFSNCWQEVKNTSLIASLRYRGMGINRLHGHGIDYLQCHLALMNFNQSTELQAFSNKLLFHIMSSMFTYSLIF